MWNAGTETKSRTYYCVSTLKIIVDKGQLISKELVGILNSSKKRTKKFDLKTVSKVPIQHHTKACIDTYEIVFRIVKPPFIVKFKPKMVISRFISFFDKNLHLVESALSTIQLWTYSLIDNCHSKKCRIPANCLGHF